MISLEVKSEEGNPVNENTEKTHPFLAIAPKSSIFPASTPTAETTTADFFRKNFGVRGKRYLNTACHSPLRIPETVQETWQKASEKPLPRLLLMLTTTTAPPGRLSEALRADPTASARRTSVGVYLRLRLFN